MNLQIQNLQQRAENGDYAAAHELGLLFYTGQNGVKDGSAALHWFEKSSKKIIEDYYLMASILINNTENDYNQNKTALKYLKKIMQNTHVYVCPLGSLQIWYYNRQIDSRII